MLEFTQTRLLIKCLKLHRSSGKVDKKNSAASVFRSVLSFFILTVPTLLQSATILCYWHHSTKTFHSAIFGEKLSKYSSQMFALSAILILTFGVVRNVQWFWGLFGITCCNFVRHQNHFSKSKRQMRYFLVCNRALVINWKLHKHD